MIEVELLTGEVVLISSCLRYRAIELSDNRKRAYEKLATHIAPIGLYQFDEYEAACIYLSLVDYYEAQEAIFKKPHEMAKWLADDFLDLLFTNHPIELIRNAIHAIKERDAIDAVYAAG